MSNQLHFLDWTILVVYFVLLIVIGLWASRKQQKAEGKDGNSFLASKSLSWHTIGLSMWGTNVGPSMLIASCSSGFAAGVVSGNYAWYAFIFIALLAFVFAPRYLGENISTLPEFMGRRFGQGTRSVLAWYTIVTILISWLALTLFAGGVLIRQIFNIPMFASALILLAISAFFTILGGLRAVAYTNVYQMTLLIIVSTILTIAGIWKLGSGSFFEGIGVLMDPEVVPSGYWNLFQPLSDPDYPWLPILLGYPVMGIWFWCTDQSMVQPVLAAKNLHEGQKGANFCGWLKILDVAIYIIPGIICYALCKTGIFTTTPNADDSYLFMVTNIFHEQGHSPNGSDGHYHRFAHQHPDLRGRGSHQGHSALQHLPIRPQFHRSSDGCRLCDGRVLETLFGICGTDDADLWHGALSAGRHLVLCDARRSGIWHQVAAFYAPFVLSVRNPDYQYGGSKPFGQEFPRGCCASKG